MVALNITSMTKIRYLGILKNLDELLILLYEQHFLATYFAIMNPHKYPSTANEVPV